MALAGGCVTSAKDDPGAGEGIVVDTSLAPNAATHAAFDDGGPERKEAVVVGPTGNRFRFIERELLVATHSQAELDGLLRRTGGKLLESWSFDADGDTSGLSYHAVRIDDSKVTREDLDGVLAALDSAEGGVKVSSDAALATLAAFASESKQGILVFPNFVLDMDQIPDRTTSEAGSALDFAGDYTPNAFDWPYMKRGGPLDIGVAEAWRVLDANGDGTTRVPVLFMDGGFKQTADLPTDTLLAGDTVFGEPNSSQCCEGTCSCQWHGTGTVRAAAARVDDDFGGAGSGGPVVQPVLLQSPVQDFFDYLRYVAGIAQGLGAAKIVNISASTTIDQWVCDVGGFFMGPAGPCAMPHALGASLRAAGYLVIASAGNDGNRDLDSGDFTMPCEMSGTMCVGGMAWNSPTRSSGSTRASRGLSGAIDIWAPFDVWVGPNPETPETNENTLFSGTSASAPFVAGVAALVKAANPSFGPNEIENAILSTAHVGSTGQVSRWINAYAAVSFAENGAVPPFIRILQPSAGSSAPHIEAAEMFSADVADAGSDLVVTWSDSVDGELGTGTTITHPGLSFGTHTITATATSHGVSHSTSVTVERTNVPPTVTIVTPATGSSFYAGQSISLLGQSSDPNEPLGQLASGQVTWKSGSTLLGTGYSVDVPPNTFVPGTYTIQFQGTDGVSTADATRSIQILPNPVNLPPSIGTITPGTGTDLGYADVMVGGEWTKAVVLSANATDPEGLTLADSAYTWKTTYTDPNTGVSTEKTLGTGKTLSTHLVGLCFAVQHVVTLTVTDGVNQSQKSAVYVVHLLC
jgi:serine protease